MPGRVGQQFGPYQLKHKIGSGSFGEVYRAEHVEHGTQVAIKVLQANLTDEQTREYFQHEARLLSQLVHPNIVHLLDYGVEHNLPFLVMEYAERGSLSSLYPLGVTLPLASLTAYIHQIAPALQYAHDQFLIHSDVKPENLLLGTNGEVLLSDLALAMLAPQGRLYPNIILRAAATILYSAPEQLTGHPVPASDQYALAIVVYKWLCGEYPFQGTRMQLQMQHMSTPPPSLVQKVPNLPPEVERVVFKALEKRPEHRFESVVAFADALANACQAAPDFFPQPAGVQKSARLWMGEALAHYYAKRYHDVITACNHALALQPDYAWAYSLRGLASYYLKAYDQAIEDYASAIEVAPKYVAAWSNRGLAYQTLGQYQQALENYNHVIALEDTDAMSYSSRGKTHFYLKAYQQAIDDCNRAIALDPRYAQAYNNRGQTYYALKKYTQAIADFKQALDLSAQQQDVWFRLGRAYAALQEDQKAIEAYNQAIEFKPKDAMAYNNRGWSYYKLKTYQQALQDFEQALSLDESRALFHTNHGLTCHELKEYAQAWQDFSRALTLDPKQSRTYFEQGRLHFTLKDYQQAILAYSEAIELDPQYTAAYNNRGWSYFCLKDYPRALVDLDKAIELNPRYTIAYNNRGWSYFALKDYPRALADLDQALAIDPVTIGAGPIFA